MTKRTRSKADPLEHEIERALSPGAFIAERSFDDFMSGLDGVSVRIAELIDTEPIIARGPRQEFEMEQVLPGWNPADYDSDPSRIPMSSRRLEILRARVSCLWSFVRSIYAA